MTIQELSDTLQELLGTDIRNGQLVLNLNDGKVQNVEWKGYQRIAQKVIAPSSASA